MNRNTQNIPKAKGPDLTVKRRAFVDPEGTIRLGRLPAPPQLASVDMGEIESRMLASLTTEGETA